MKRNEFVDNVFLGHLESFHVDTQKSLAFLHNIRQMITNGHNEAVKLRLKDTPAVGTCSMTQVWISAALTLKNRKALAYAVDQAIIAQENYCAQWKEANSDLPYSWHSVKQHI